MTPLIAEYVATLGPRTAGRLRGRARLEITGEGVVLLSETGAAPGAPDAPADVVLSASDAVFRAIFAGEQNPVMAYMSGKLQVEGNIKRALRVSGILVGG